MTVFQAAHLILVFFVTCESHQQIPLLAVLEKKHEPGQFRTMYLYL